MTHEKIMDAAGSTRSRDDVVRLAEMVKRDTIEACARAAELHGALTAAEAIRRLA